MHFSMAKRFGVEMDSTGDCMHPGRYTQTLFVAAALCAVAGTAAADIFVYQLPGGARIVTDHPLSSRDYKLVRHSRDTKGAGALVSSRKIAYAVTDPSAYDRLIHRTARANQVDAALVKAVMHVESGFNPHAVSDKGAQGLMQLMPDTAQRYGAEDLFDPVQNVRAGVLYLKDLQKMFKNNTRLVLAAYNAGENAVLRHRGIPPYDETQDYVRKVMKMHREYTAEEHAATKTKMVVAAAPAPRLLVPATAPAVAPSTVTVPATAELVPVAAVQPVSESVPEKKL